LYRYGSNEILDSTSYESDEGNPQLEFRVAGPFTQKVERKQGRIYITLGDYRMGVNITQSDIDHYDRVIEVRPFALQENKCGFAPFILHKKR